LVTFFNPAEPGRGFYARGPSVAALSSLAYSVVTTGPTGTTAQPPPPKHHHRFELRVIPRTLAMDITEGVLANALVAFIGGSRPQVSPEQVHVFLECIMRLQEDDVQIKHYDYSGADFMLIFASRQLTDQVLHATQPQDTGFLLIF
jgi:hypothetical protein